MKHDQWKTDMKDGVDLAHSRSRGLSVTEATRLHKSTNATSDPDRMKDDTIFRTDGRCGANTPERISGIAGAFHDLNQGRDGG